MAEVHPVDWVLGALLLYGAWTGFRSGLVVVVVNTIALLCAVILAFRLLATASEWLGPWVEDDNPLLPLLSFALVFGLTLFGLRWFARFAGKSLRGTLLGPFDQAGGAVLGLFRMGLVLCSVLLSLRALGLKGKIPGAGDSVLIPVLEEVSVQLFGLLRPLLPFLKDFISELAA